MNFYAGRKKFVLTWMGVKAGHGKANLKTGGLKNDVLMSEKSLF
jgi:hypothetical protein